MSSARKMVILTEGFSEPIAAKTAASVVRYRRSDVVALLDSTQAGKTAGGLIGAGDDLPVCGSLDQAPQADTLLLGIAPPGGKIPLRWRQIILDAIARGMDIVSGLHDFLSRDEQFVAAARQAGVRLVDVRQNNEREVAVGQPLGDDCLRIHTVGHDCSVGKMVVSIEVANGLRQAGADAQFVATGQTGIMIAGEGCPIDCVVSDFVCGAAERLILANQSHDILLIEGQGSLAHPRYSPVTLGLLHGCQPHGLILCYEVGRMEFNGLPGRRIPPLAQLRTAYEIAAQLVHPAPVMGIAMNGRQIAVADAEHEKARIRDEFRLPVCDVFRDGPGELVAAVLAFRDQVRAHRRECGDSGGKR
jgi:uncharacterized NAD-dependent epimerase/dehydratase family protein